MYIKILFNYLLGYVTITIEGYFVERFMNSCIKEGIFLWNTKREKTTILHANIGIHDFKRISHIAKQSKCKIKLDHKKGFPFIFQRYKKRKIFAVCVGIIMLLILSLSNFIWNIEITGTNRINPDELLQLVYEDGLKVGTLKNKVNTKDIINKIRLNRSDIAWIGIELQGTNAVVKVVEADPKPDIINEEDYCNISATQNAEIVKIKAQNGTPLVKEGDIVKPGTVLIAGWLEGKYTGTRYVHAKGEVEAKVWYTETQKIYYQQEKKEQTGKIENKYTICLHNFEINLYKTLSKFENYDTIRENKKLKLFSNFYLPIGLTKQTNYEATTSEVTLRIRGSKGNWHSESNRNIRPKGKKPRIDIK